MILIAVLFNNFIRRKAPEARWHDHDRDDRSLLELRGVSKSSAR